MAAWLSRFIRPSPPEPGYDLLADPALAGFTGRDLADLPLWPAPDEPAAPPGRPRPTLDRLWQGLREAATRACGGSAPADRPAACLS